MEIIERKKQDQADRRQDKKNQGRLKEILINKKQ